MKHVYKRLYIVSNDSNTATRRPRGSRRKNNMRLSIGHTQYYTIFEN